jgi:hypothetical protein
MYWRRGITFDASGNLYIAAANNRRVRVVNTSGTINTFAGNGKGMYGGDGGLTKNAAIGFAVGVTISSGTLYATTGGCTSVLLYQRDIPDEF